MSKYAHDGSPHLASALVKWGRKYVFRGSGPSEFDKHVLTLFWGNALTGAIIFLSTPMLSRIYAPEDFGLLHAVFATTMLFNGASTLKYETAIVMAADEKESMALASLSFLILLTITLSVALLLLAGDGYIVQLLKTDRLRPYYPIILVLLLFQGIGRIQSSLLIHQRAFRHFSLLNVVRVFFRQTIATAYGLVIIPHVRGLLSGRVVAEGMTCILVFLRYPSWLKQRHSFAQLQKLAVKYRQFPLIATASQYVHTLTLHAHVFMILRFFDEEHAGYYTVAAALIEQSFGVITGAVSNVYFKAASQAFQEKGALALRQVYLATLKKTFIIIVLPTVALIIGGTTLLPFFLGETWHEAGKIIRILAIWKFFELVNRPVSATFAILNKQQILLYLRLFSLVLRFCSILAFHQTFTICMLALTCSASVHYILYTVIQYRYITRLLKENVPT